MDGFERRELCLGTADEAEADRRAAVHLAPAAVPAPAADPAPHEQAQYTVEHALNDLLSRGCTDNAERTRECYRQRGGHVLRLLGAQPLEGLHMDQVQRYIDARVGEGAAPETIRKELVVLRRALDLAFRRSQAGPVPEAIMPRFRARYVPRKVWLSPDQFEALLAALEPHRQRWILVAVYVGPCLSELERMDWRDVKWAEGLIHVRGTKNTHRDRFVPLHPRLAAVLTECRRVQGPLVQRWPNVRRDLAVACKHAGVPRVTSNDLRRTFASWLVQAGESSYVVGQLMGHSSSHMVERVYGRLATKTMRDAVNKLPEP
jgi:integrase